MYRSHQEEFDLIYVDEHIVNITKLIDNNFEQNLKLIINKYRSDNSYKNDSECVRRLFEKKIQEFDKEAEKYKKVFSEKSLNRIKNAEKKKKSLYYNQFKDSLKKDCPIIKYGFTARIKELEEWQISFAKTSSEELFEIFKNLLNFAKEYSESYEESEYDKYVNLNDFEFDEIEEEDYIITGVIGMGIKSATIYHLYPDIFPKRGKLDLFGMYFLTEQDKYFSDFPTKTSEFIMINDEATGQKGTYKLDQNYWYPYSLFTSYAMKIYKMIFNKCKQMNIDIDPKYRYVYVNTYLEKICENYADNLKTLTKSSDISNFNKYQ